MLHRLILALALLLVPSPVLADKRIALSFDDVPRDRGGFFTPDQRTARIIAALKATRAPQAVFFVVPGQIGHDDGVGGERRIAAYVRAGNVIANHSWSHRHLSEIGALAFLDDLDKAHAWLRQRAGFRPWFRFPYLDEGGADKARRDLEFTTVRAPFDGVVGNRAAQLGALVAPGTRLMSLIPLDSVYVEANFKETQLGGLKPGQKVRLVVDAYAKQTIEGVVESVAPASGAQYSMLPPENATGNFTKIVQRVPVRIRVPAEVAKTGILRPGMSVVVDVDTRTQN